MLHIFYIITRQKKFLHTVRTPTMDHQVFLDHSAALHATFATVYRSHLFGFKVIRDEIPTNLNREAVETIVMSKKTAIERESIGILKLRAIGKGQWHHQVNRHFIWIPKRSCQFRYKEYVRCDIVVSMRQTSKFFINRATDSMNHLFVLVKDLYFVVG